MHDLAGDWRIRGETAKAECRRHLAVLLGGGEAQADNAHRLIETFGSLGAVLSANRRGALAHVCDDDVASRLKAIVEATRHVLRQRVERRPLLRLTQALADYLAFDMAVENAERFRVLFLNPSGHLIADQTISEGSRTSTPIRRRDLISRVLQLDATDIILVHNHPSGDPTPSISDIDLTRRLARAMTVIDVRVLDHFIISRSKCTSFRRMGLL